ncbi:MAG: sugar phosphate isomerase/epimerase [Geminicoccaceae bacterium]|nr:sugar phosphate isomerase/epimerase [Geminicoccaceae bacterium]
MRRTSIGSWAYNVGPYGDNPVPFDTVLAKVAELKFDGVELGGFNGYPNPQNHPTSDDRAALKEKVAAHGLEFSGFAQDLWSEHLLDTGDPAAYVKAFEANADFARDVGIRRIRVDCVQPPTIHGTVDYDTLFGRLTTTWDHCIRYAGDRGLTVSWEFEPGFAFNKPSDLERVLDALPHENFGIMYDTCHGQMVAVNGSRQYGEKEVCKGGQLELIRRLSGRINHIHLIDSDNTCHKDAQGEDETSTHPPFGLGMLDFDSLVPALAKEDVGHDWWTVDLCFWPDAWNATATCKAALDELNRKYG